MTSHLHKKSVALVAGLVAVAALAASTAPAGATIVCPPGHPPPSPYCMNVRPTATTVAATNVTSGGATLNGVAGPGVVNGDSTKYAFQYGTTTLYGLTTPIATVASGPATSPVAATITGLNPGTTYHFEIVSSNSDGVAIGGDVTFKTAVQVQPIKFVHAPGRVRHDKKFTVKVKLNLRSNLTIELVFHGHTVRSFHEGSVTGTVHQRIRAPHKKGKYTLRVTAKGPGFQQTVKHPLTVF